MKKLLFYAFAIFAFVACNEAEEITPTAPQAPAVKGDAFITVAFSSSNNSGGRAGDSHQTVDDNGHHNAGTAAENKVDEALVIIAKCSEAGELTTPTTDGTTNGIVAFLPVSSFAQQATGAYSLNIPYRMDYLGNYKVLVVINPVDGLKTAVGGQNHKAAYETVCSYVGQARTGAAFDGNFMMANKSECVVTATNANNTSEKPAMANVSVERVISKVTFRYAEPDASFPETLKDKPNVYKVKTNVAGVITAVTDNFWYIVDKTVDELDYVYQYATNLNKAVDKAGNEYWVMIESGFTVQPGGQLDPASVVAIWPNTTSGKYMGIYSSDGGVTTTQVEDDLLSVDYNTAVANATPALVQSLTFVHDAGAEASTDTYYVELTDYALTNLSKEVYAVRHINDRQFGILADGEYLKDPQTNAKNAAAVEDYPSFFNQDITSVQTAIHNATYNGTGLPTAFRTLPSEIEADAVTGVDTPHGEYNSIGAHLQYVYENAVNADKQVRGLVTGVIFSGKIYDQNGDPVPVMYKYNQQFFRTLRALLNSYGSDPKLSSLTENSTNQQAMAAGVDVYVDGRCFYYSAQIKHFEDNLNDQLGVMEYAIMRNNIYSLKVASIADLGDARLNLSPSQSVVDVRAYISLEVSILPWIVRFNDLDL